MKKIKIILLAIVLLGPAAVYAEDKLTFEIVSADLKNDGEIPLKNTCFAADVNPALEFRNIPSKTKSFALTFHSPDAPEGTWVHWVVYNIPLVNASFAENTIPGEQAFNDFGKFNYAGPCPTNDKEQHYIFTAYALDKKIDLVEGSIMKDLEKAISGRVLAKATLTTTFRKSSL